jgi:hypothetical protein
MKKKNNLESIKWFQRHIIGLLSDLDRLEFARAFLNFKT